jgi:hypothetical protein
VKPVDLGLLCGKEGFTALMVASRSGRTEYRTCCPHQRALRSLVSFCTPEGKDGFTALMFASRTGRTEYRTCCPHQRALRSLVSFCTPEGKEGFTTLMVASRSGKTEHTDSLDQKVYTVSSESHQKRVMIKEKLQLIV